MRGHCLPAYRSSPTSLLRVYRIVRDRTLAGEADFQVVSAIADSLCASVKTASTHKACILKNAYAVKRSADPLHD